MSPSSSVDIRARRHPWLIIGVWLWELACAYVIATPVHAWARASWSAHPFGDEPIFNPGGLALIEWLNADGPALSIVLRVTALLFAVFGLASNVITGAVVAALATKGTKLAGALRVGIESFLPLLATGVIFVAIEGFFLGVGFFLSSWLDHASESAYGDERSWLFREIVLGIFLVLMLVVGVVGDLARVAVARDVALGTSKRPVRNGIRTALFTARAKLGRACLAWGWRTAIALFLIGAGATASDLTRGRAGGVLWLLFGFHQLMILGRAALRTSWLANALRLVEPPANEVVTSDP